MKSYMPQVISMTPRLKTSDARSPMLTYVHDGPKRATSMAEIDPIDFMIERQQSVISNEMEGI